MASAENRHAFARSSSTLDVYTDGSSLTANEESEKLLSPEEYGRRRPRPYHRRLEVLWASNAFFMVVAFILAIKLYTTDCRDPSLQVYSPANGAVSYIAEHKFTPALGKLTEYMGYPDDETDRKWQELYQYNRSVITKEEAKHLSTPTMALPGTEDYLVELEVYHQLHCLNVLRKLLYPERYHLLERVSWKNGTINRESYGFKHWDHCVETLRQTLVCHADVAPLSWHVNVPFNRGIYPRLASTHTCRNFSQINKWAEEHQAPEFTQKVKNRTELQQIIDGTDIDHSTEEDLQDMYELFPGDQWFKHWREHPYDGEVKQPQIYPTWNHTWDD
ncbi:unnamed protein product [Zymoseptoria tritici ST99CH_1A5]|uniref:Tat pathway signal sequence n=1 Tax=Zymoseptoria tritici ST99CH_1A5 TaxID=1276529 RepID=A0A1Y6L944_ZYMTR|nr:unnamed protein product [Zymoseptoria tritici ST99CH_1A5]